MQNIKIVCVGDGAVGKSSMLITYSENRFPVDYVPTVFDNFTTGIEYKKKLLNIALWDTAGQEEYSRLRALSYQDADLFLVCFSVTQPSSLENIRYRWIPELVHHCPTTKLLLVGLKIDLRKDGNEEHSTTQKGIALAKDLGMETYVECSSLTSNGLAHVFNTAYDCILSDSVNAPLSMKKKKQKKNQNRIALPSLPPAAKAPWLNVLPSEYGKHRQQMLNSKRNCDVCFLLGGNKNEPSEISIKPTKRAFEYVDQDLDEELLCSVCLEPFENGVTHNVDICRNCFCRDCVSPLHQCPLCREPMDQKDLSLMPRLIHNTINKLYVKCSTCHQQTTRGEFDNHSCSKVINPKKKQTKNEVSKPDYDLFDAPMKITETQSELWAHQLILASSSVFFQRLFHVKNTAKQIISSKFIDSKDIEQGKVAGITSMRAITKNNRSVCYIELSPDISQKVFQCVLEFLYCGEPLSMIESDWEEVKRVAMIFGCNELITICKNCIEHNEWLNPSIGTWLNDENGTTLLQLFSLQNSNHLADVHWQDFHCHSPLLYARIPTILEENNRKRIVELSCSQKKRALLRTLLDYVYSDHCAILPQNQFELMSVAYEMKQYRLVSLCELYISKSIQEATSQEVEKANIDVIAILNQANSCAAHQLREFCLHFIATNYQAMILRKEWKNLNQEDREYIEANKWPPQSYIDEIEKYEREIRPKTKGDCTIQ